VFTVWRTPTAATLPAACRAYAEVEAAGCIAVDVATATRTPITADRVPAAGAAGLARHLAPVADAGAVPVDDSDLPPSQSYLRLRDSQAADEVAEIVERWRENGSLVGSGARSGEPSLRALVGRTATEPLYLDLHAQGPHALVGGTTGAGKSELLQTWVLGMALGYSPQRVNFLFVDYKGGAAFAECLKLPHTVGVVTDLTPHLVRRALTSLRAELRFREHLLNAEGAKDLATLERRGSASAPPRLVIVVDEFAALVQEVPEFIDGVVDVAQRGRSLGLHLILATQRPAGVIKDNLRANTNLRLALRMADAADSTDILQEPLAAEFDPSIPGRAAVRSGPGRLTVFQTGYVGGRTAGTRDAPAVAVTELTFGVGAIWKEPAPQVVESPAPAGPNDLANMVGWLKTASRSLELALPRKPWNDVVPPLVDLVDLRPRTDEALPFALVDVPAEQTRRVHAYRPDEEGNLVAFGAGGSGKTTLLRTLAAAAGMTRKGGPVQVYAIDAASGGLAMLTELPHVGAVIAGEDFERVERLLRWLRAVVDERAVEYSELRAGSIVEYRSQAGKPDEPRILILIDGLATLVEQLESSGRARQVTALQQLAGEGRQVGVHFAVTADRLTAVPFGMRSTLQNRVVLRLADEGDYGLLGASVDVLSLSSPPGRAVLGDLEMQVAVLGGEATVAAQATEFRDLADSLRHAGAGLRAHPSPIERLPALVPSDTLKPAGDGRPVLGIADETLAPFAFDPRGVLLVSGPPGSGRTTALAALVAATLQAEPLTRCYYVGSPHSPLATGRPWSGAALDPAAAAVLAEELRGRLTVAAPGTVPPLIVLDGLSDFTSTPAEAALEAVVRAAGGGAALLLAEGETTALAQYGSLPQALKAPRRGLVLQPDINDADILRTALPKAHRRDFPPGRGYFVERGNATKVQVALPE
jgi:S-DNA-T family DNA segregation ATPase FtsK/SpoIIIE